MTTDDEIRAAADRLRPIFADGDWHDWDEIPVDVADDMATLARAYLNPWRPISEAPRDGTEVDLWMEIPRSATNFGDSFRVPDCSYRKGKWGHQHKGGWTELRQECITHWTTLPLPPAPAA